MACLKKLWLFHCVKNFKKRNEIFFFPSKYLSYIKLQIFKKGLQTCPDLVFHNVLPNFRNIIMQLPLWKTLWQNKIKTISSQRKYNWYIRRTINPLSKFSTFMYAIYCYHPPKIHIIAKIRKTKQNTHHVKKQNFKKFVIIRY